MDVKQVKAVLLLLELVLVACESGAGSGDGYEFKSKLDDMMAGLMAKRQGKGYTKFDDNEADAIVERHNFHRSNTKPSASNMKHMTWDSDLAEMAQRWADNCFYDHGGQEGTANISPFQPKVGQNLAIWTGQESDQGVLATDRWHSEEEFFTYGPNTCRPNEQCGHYTQIVWADSYTVGCGITVCRRPTGKLRSDYDWTDATYVVCDYGPGGNVYDNNGNMYNPFKTGERCSACPDDASFCTDNSLCRACSGVSDRAACGECNRNCENCGTLDAAACTCQCAPGWDGPTCTEKCADHHEWCDVPPGVYGWGPYTCTDPTHSVSALKYCLKMCGICQSEDPSFVCGEDGDDGNGGGGGGGGTNKNTKYCKTSFTATAVIDGNMFVFKKDKYWRFDDTKNGNLLTSAGGDLVKDAFPKVNPDVKAVYQRPDNKVVFMRGAKYWLYTMTSSGWTRDAGFPRDISQTFPGLSSPTAGVYDQREGKTYLFSGPNFWRYDERRQQFDIENQRISSMFEGVPNKISGAFIDDNSDFIFLKGKDFWRVQRGQQKVSSAEPENLALEYLDC